MDENQPRIRINGQFLANYVGKQVCLLGKATMTDRNGMSFQMTTSDKQNVTVRMQDPLQELIHGLVEVHGTAASRSEVQCYNYVLFPESTSENFDMDGYDKTVRFMQNFPDHYITMN